MSRAEPWTPGEVALVVELGDRVDLDRHDAAVLVHELEAQDLGLGRVGRDPLPALGRDVHRRRGDDTCRTSGRPRSSGRKPVSRSIVSEMNTKRVSASALNTMSGAFSTRNR